MTSIEKKIKNNKLLFEQKFVRSNDLTSLANDKVKVEFRSYWDKGWDNGRNFRPIEPTPDETTSDGKKSSR